MPKNLTPNFHFALLLTSLFTALLPQVPAQLLSLFQVLILCFLLSTLSPCFPTQILHCPAVTSALPQPLIHILVSTLSLFHYHKMSCILLSQALLSKKPLYPATIKKSSLFNQVLQLLNPGERLEKAEEHSLVLVFNTVLLVPLNQHFMPTALMGKWNADKIQPKLNQLSRGLDTSIDTLTPRTLDKVQDFVSQVIYPDMGHIVMLIEIYFLVSGKMAMQSIPSPSTREVKVSPLLCSKFGSWRRERNPVKSAETAEGRQHMVLSRWETQEKQQEGSAQRLTQNPDSSAPQGRTGRGN